VAPAIPTGVPDSIPIPIDRYDLLRMFARCPRLFIHARPIERGVERLPEP
jgi:hypothetical protein